MTHINYIIDGNLNHKKIINRPNKSIKIKH